MEQKLLSITEQKIDQERAEAYVLSKALFQYLSQAQDCDESCQEAKRFLNKYERNIRRWVLRLRIQMLSLVDQAIWGSQEKAIEHMQMQ